MQTSALRDPDRDRQAQQGQSAAERGIQDRSLALAFQGEPATGLFDIHMTWDGVREVSRVHLGPSRLGLRTDASKSRRDAPARPLDDRPGSPGPSSPDRCSITRDHTRRASRRALAAAPRLRARARSTTEVATVADARRCFSAGGVSTFGARALRGLPDPHDRIAEPRPARAGSRRRRYRDRPPAGITKATTSPSGTDRSGRCDPGRGPTRRRARRGCLQGARAGARRGHDRRLRHRGRGSRPRWQAERYSSPPRSEAAWRWLFPPPRDAQPAAVTARRASARVEGLSDRVGGRIGRWDSRELDVEPPPPTPGLCTP